MSSVKKEARLSGILLARKGSALPAHTDHRLTIQAFDAQQTQSKVSRTTHQDFKAETSDHNGFVKAVKEINDVTKRQYNKVLSATEPKVEPKVAEKSEVSKAPSAVKVEKTVLENTDKAAKRIAMTLRMEQDDHLKLRLYAAYSRKSCQEIISAALDMYLNEDKKVCGLSDYNSLTN
tara:strand:+ start:1817 stop:2347 length:531 start_codon:yes stop_codon:yes gene_type:complete